MFVTYKQIIRYYLIYKIMRYYFKCNMKSQ